MQDRVTDSTRAHGGSFTYVYLRRTPVLRHWPEPREWNLCNIHTHLWRRRLVREIHKHEVQKSCVTIISNNITLMDNTLCSTNILYKTQVNIFWALYLEYDMQYIKLNGGVCAYHGCDGKLPVLLCLFLLVKERKTGE